MSVVFNDASSLPAAIRPSNIDMPDRDYKPISDYKMMESSNNECVSTPGSNYDLSYYFQSSEADNNNNNNNNSSQVLPPPLQPLATTANVTYKRGRSLSIGSTLSISQPPPPQLQPFVLQSEEIQAFRNKLQTFKDKTDMSNRKAYQFFGERVKLEISAKEVKREGLRALLYSTVPLGYFLYHLLNEYSSENLFFYLAVENYQNYKFSSHQERYQVANKISKTYLTRESAVEVNLEDRIYRIVIKELDDQRQKGTSTGKEFDAAKKHVFSLLNASYHRFRTSSVWGIMESKYDLSTSKNSARSQALIVNLLLTFVKQKSRDSTIFKLVHSFCRIYLPLGYDARSEEFETKRSRSKSVGSQSKKSSIVSKFDIFKISRK